MVQTRAKKAGNGKEIAEDSSSKNRNDVGNDTSGNRKRKDTNQLDSINDDVATKKMSCDGFFNDDTINVKMPNGRIKSLKVKESDTFGRIKLKIQADEHIPFDHQELVYNEEVQLDTDTLSNLYMKKGDILTLMTKSNGLITIFVVLDLYTTLSVYVKPDVTIGEVKCMTNDCCPGEVAMTFNETVLEDSCTLAGSNVIDGSILKVLKKSLGDMTIKVNMYTRETITLAVDVTDTIQYVKSAIQEQEGVEHNEQVLIFNNMVLGNGSTLFDFGINRNSTLTLMHRPWQFTASRQRMRIFIKTLTGETITQEVGPFETIGNIKAKIEDKVDVPCREQELIFNEMVLSDVNTLGDFNINKESTLTLMRISSGLMRIFVKVGQETVTLDVRPSNTIKDVKSKIFDMGKISKNMKDLGFLSFNWKRMEDNAIFADYDIPKESTVHLSEGKDYRIRNSTVRLNRDG